MQNDIAQGSFRNTLIRLQFTPVRNSKLLQRNASFLNALFIASAVLNKNEFFKNGNKNEVVTADDKKTNCFIILMSTNQPKSIKNESFKYARFSKIEKHNLYLFYF